MTGQNMMKAVVIQAFGGPEVLTVQDIQLAEPGPGQVLVKVMAAGINFMDTGARRGLGAGEHLQSADALLRDFPLPIVTAVNGPAAGIGCSIALMGDIVVAGESAYFLQAFRRIGLVPDGGSTYLLPRLIGKARAMEMMLLGDKIPAATALQWGLVNRCVPDAELIPTAHALAVQLAQGPAALGTIRRLVWDSLDNDWTGQLHAERKAQKVAGPWAS